MDYKAINLTELIMRAKLGDSRAIGEIMRKYSPLIRKKSWYRGMYDEDCRQHISLYLLEQLQNFTIQEVPFF